MVSVCSAPALDNTCLCVDTSGLWCLSILHQCWAASVHVFTPVVHGVCLNILYYCWIVSVCVFTRMICGVCPFCSSLCLHKWFMVLEYFAPVLDSTVCLCVHSCRSWCLSGLLQCWTASVCVFAQVVCGVCLFCTVSVGSICLCVHSNGLWCLSALCQCWTASVCVFTQMVCGVCLFCTSVGQYVSMCLQWRPGLVTRRSLSRCSS